MALLSVAALDDFTMTCSESDCDLAFSDFGAFAAGEVGFFLPPPAAAGPLGSLLGPQPPRRRRRTAGEADGGKSRGNYNCSKCGQPKRGHGACLQQPRRAGVQSRVRCFGAAARARAQRARFARELTPLHVDPP